MWGRGPGGYFSGIFLMKCDSWVWCQSIKASQTNDVIYGLPLFTYTDIFHAFRKNYFWPAAYFRGGLVKREIKFTDLKSELEVIRKV